MKKNLLAGVALCLLLLISFILGIKLDYPPNSNELATLVSSQLMEENLQPAVKNKILYNIVGESFYENERFFPLRGYLQILGQKNVNNLRAFNLVFLTAGLFVFGVFLKKIGFSVREIFFTLIILIISPLFFSLWLFQPNISLTLLFLAIGLLLIIQHNINNYLLGILFLITFLLSVSSLYGFIISTLVFIPAIIIKIFQKKKFVFLPFLFILIAFFTIPTLKEKSIQQQLQKITLYNHITKEGLEAEIQDTIRSEDSLQEKVNLPIWFRRLGYNKFFFTYKNITKETLGYFDLETLFFQEFHPSRQKSEVIFYWPEIFLFLAGFFFVRKKTSIKNKKIFIIGMCVSLLYYLISTDSSPSFRHLLTLFLFAPIVGIGISNISKKVLYIPLIIIIWASWINYYDIFNRPLFWYDNRPYIYSQAVLSIKNSLLQPQPPSKIYLTSIVGNPKLYFFYYLKPNFMNFANDSIMLEFQKAKIYFNSFDLQNENITENTLYAGFLGEYIGPNFSNEFQDNDINKIEKMDLQIQKILKTNDSIAHKYGDLFILAYKEPK